MRSQAKLASVRLILPAAAIPEEARVCKPTGDKLYTLRRTILVYPAPGSKPEDRIELTAPAEQVFLCDDSGNINAWSKELSWVVTLEQLDDWLCSQPGYDR